MSSKQSLFVNLRRNTVGDFETKLEQKGDTVAVTFEGDRGPNLDRQIEVAEAIWKQRVSWFSDFREFIVDNLLDDLNSRSHFAEFEAALVSATKLRKIVRAPFCIRLACDDDEPLYFTLCGGDHPDLHERIFEVTGTLAGGLEDGEIVNLF